MDEEENYMQMVNDIVYMPCRRASRGFVHWAWSRIKECFAMNDAC